MGFISRYLNLLQRETNQIADQLGFELFGLVAVVLIAAGWMLVRGGNSASR